LEQLDLFAAALKADLRRRRGADLALSDFAAAVFATRRLFRFIQI